TVFGGAGNDSITGGAGVDYITGGEGNDTLQGNDNNDNLDGGGGNDSLTGGADGDTLQGGDGNDTVAGNGGTDFLRGGNGNDLFTIAAADSGTAAGSLDQILDWEATDALDFAVIGAATDGVNYIELTASTYDAALTLANTQIANGNDYVVIQVGADVVVFADTGNNNGTAEDAVALVGRTLADISAGNIAI
ncbi:MAG: calcium-binding protein, partial [Phenylobacterium sp.]|nr:calcium-binding protein [Phenylobacterium sp.]